MAKHLSFDYLQTVFSYLHTLRSKTSVWFFLTTLCSSMLSSHKNTNGFHETINPKGHNGINGHNGHSIDDEWNYRNNSTPFANSTHEANVTKKKIREPHDHTLYQLNAGIYHGTKALPMPPFDDMPVPIPGGFCEKSGTTVIFDEDVHLNLGKLIFIF